MAHMLERLIFNSATAYGVKIGVYSGDNRKLITDIQILKPTIFVSVPRMFNKIFETV